VALGPKGTVYVTLSAIVTSDKTGPGAWLALRKHCERGHRPPLVRNVAENLCVDGTQRWIYQYDNANKLAQYATPDGNGE
jgi:hypothetical protein